MTAPLRIGVVGCGDISSLHLDAIGANPDAVLVGVADTDPQAAAAVAGPRQVAAYPDLGSLLAGAHPDVVHVCTPHHLHAAMAITCLDKGIHVLLEKPLATTAADGAAVVLAARSSTASLGVCFQNRYNPAVRAMRELVLGDAVGRVLGGRATVTWARDAGYYARRPWRGTWAEAGGGVLVNQAVHTLDLLQWLLGDVTDVRGSAVRLTPLPHVEVDDTATLQLTHAGGRRSLFFASNGYLTNAPVTVELQAEQGILRLDTDLRILHADGRTEIVTDTPTGTGEKAYWGAFHGVLVDDFYRHVRSGASFWIGAEEASRTLEIVTAVYAQSTHGNADVARAPTHL